jgi:4-amino-4-deoxy-L-arabinose transferase-like glycosyltransferase
MQQLGELSAEAACGQGRCTPSVVITTMPSGVRAATAGTSPKARRSLRPRQLLRALVVLELVALVVLAGVTVSRFRVWADVDERPHYDYIQTVVEEQRLPRPTDLVSPEVQAISDRTWPRPSPTDRAAIGLPGRSYEAMQPPLYYLVAAPAFTLAGDHRDKVYVVRAFDMALLLLAVWLLWRLARRLAGPEPALLGVAVALLVLLWPGVLVRVITISNTPLELVLTTAFLLVLSRADRETRLAPTLGAAVLLGLCLLTKLSLVYLVPLFLLVLARRLKHEPTGKRLAGVLAIAAIPVALLSPWLIANLDRYGSPTVGITGEQGVVGPITSTGALDRIADLPRLNARLLDGVLPQEWILQLEVWWVRGIVDVLALVLLAAAGTVLVLRRREWVTWFLTLPFLSGLALMNVTYVLTGNDAIYLRYLYPAVLPLALGVGLAARRRPPDRIQIAAITALGLLTAVLWVDMAAVFWFNDLGRKLGLI